MIYMYYVHICIKMHLHVNVYGYVYVDVHIDVNVYGNVRKWNCTCFHMMMATKCAHLSSSEGAQISIFLVSNSNVSEFRSH